MTEFDVAMAAVDAALAARERAEDYRGGRNVVPQRRQLVADAYVLESEARVVARGHVCSCIRLPLHQVVL